MTDTTINDRRAEPPHQPLGNQPLGPHVCGGEEMNTRNVLRSAFDTASFPSRRRTEYNS